MIKSILDWGVDIIIWFQQFSPMFDQPFKMFTFLGEPEFFILLLPLVYWCIDRRIGVKLSLLFLLSAYINVIIKVLVAQPRPFEYTHQVQKLCKASGGGFPSGHTQGSVVFWGYIAVRFKRTWLWLCAWGLFICVPLSRIYLGVHFPTDVLGGYLIGIMFLLICFRFEQKIEAWLKRKSFNWRLGAAIILPILMFLLPVRDKDSIILTASLMGMGTGFVLERKFVGFKSRGIWWKRILRYLLGIIILFILHLGLQSVFSNLKTGNFFQIIDSLLIGLWGGLGAPWVFVRLRLADTHKLSMLSN